MSRENQVVFFASNFNFLTLTGTRVVISIFLESSVLRFSIKFLSYIKTKLYIIDTLHWFLLLFMPPSGKISPIWYSKVLMTEEGFLEEALKRYYLLHNRCCIVDDDQCDQKNCQMSIKSFQKWFHYKNYRFRQLYKNCLRMWEIWAN